MKADAKASAFLFIDAEVTLQLDKLWSKTQGDR
jgi:hypothetical protein